jgi:hypothetical protein
MLGNCYRCTTVTLINSLYKLLVTNVIRLAYSIKSGHQLKHLILTILDIVLEQE